MLAIASTMGGMAFQNALVGCVHGMAHALGGMYGLHHGLANSILLPHGMRFNMPVSAPRYRQVAEAFGLDVKGKSDAQIGEMTVQAVEVFTKRTGLRRSFPRSTFPGRICWKWPNWRWVTRHEIQPPQGYRSRGDCSCPAGCMVTGGYEPDARQSTCERSRRLMRFSIALRSRLL
jgi:hypothetical protein